MKTDKCRINILTWLDNAILKELYCFDLNSFSESEHVNDRVFHVKTCVLDCVMFPVRKLVKDALSKPLFESNRTDPIAFIGTHLQNTKIKA